MIINFQSPHQYLLDEIDCFILSDGKDEKLCGMVNWLSRSQAQMACQLLHMDFQRRDSAPEYMPLSEATLEQILLTVQKMNVVFSSESHMAH